MERTKEERHVRLQVNGSVREQDVFSNNLGVKRTGRLMSISGDRNYPEMIITKMEMDTDRQKDKNIKCENCNEV